MCIYVDVYICILIAKRKEIFLILFKASAILLLPSFKGSLLKFH